MPKVTEAYDARKRAEIIAAARACYAREGIHGTTMAHVIAEGTLSASAVYRIFASKQKLSLAVIADVIARVGEATAQRLAQVDTTSADTFLDALTDLAAEPAADPTDQAIAIQAWAEARRDPELAAALVRTYQEIETRARDLLGGHAGRARLLLSVVAGSYVAEAMLPSSRR